MTRWIVVGVATLGVAVAVLGFVLVIVLGQNSAVKSSLAKQQRLIGALQRQVTDLGGTPLTAPPTVPSRHPTPLPGGSVGDGGSVGATMRPVPVTTAPRPPARSTSRPPAPAPSRPSARPSRSPTPSRSPVICNPLLCVSPLPSPILGHHMDEGKVSRGSDVQTLGQSGLIVGLLVVTGVACYRK